MPRWLPHCKPFSPWLRSWRRSPLPTAIPIAAKRIGLGFVRFRQCGGGGPKAQEDHHTGTGVSVLGKPCIPPTRQPADLELDSEPWSNVDSTLPQMQSLAPPISAKLAKRLQTLWDFTVPYSAKRQLHEDYARRPSYLPLFVVPQLPKELSLKLTKT